MKTPQVIPAADLSATLTAAGWPPEQQSRLLADLKECRAIGCPRYPVEVNERYVTLIEPAWEYDPDTRRPRVKPIDQGSVQRFWRDDVNRPWVQRVSNPDELRREK